MCHFYFHNNFDKCGPILMSRLHSAMFAFNWRDSFSRPWLTFLHKSLGASTIYIISSSLADNLKTCTHLLANSMQLMKVALLLKLGLANRMRYTWKRLHVLCVYQGFWTRKRVPKDYERCCCGSCYQIFKVLRLFEVFPFHNRLILNFGYTLVTIFTIPAPCRISK